MYKNFEINRTNIKGGCQSGRKVVTHNSKNDLPLCNIIPFSDSIDSEVDNRDEIAELIESFRIKAINLLELLDLSLPTVAKLRVSF